MQNDQLKEFLQSAFPDVKIEDNSSYINLVLDKSNLFSTAKFLKENNNTQFDYLKCETAIDRNNQFEVVYHLYSTVHLHSIFLKVILDNRENPEIDSIVSLWKAADLHECEIYDLMGIKFLNHPHLRRIFLGDEWKGFPLRKDYVQLEDQY